MQEKSLMWTKVRQQLWEWRGIVMTAPCAAGLAIALQVSGGLQLLEWAALDSFFRLRPPEAPDARVVIVAIDELDIQKAGQWPISDAVLANLLEKVKQQQPRAIGLDIYRDLPVEPGHQALVKVFETTPNLIGVEKVVADAYGSAVSPPLILSRKGQIAAVDSVLDADGKLRRALLSLSLEEGEIKLTLGAKLALMYLEAEGIELQAINGNNERIGLGKAVFDRFDENDGSYVGADAGGYQILLNFRGFACRSRSELAKFQKQPCTFRAVSMSEVLSNRIPPDLMRDRIVLIGTTAPSINDFLLTPYSSSLGTIPVRMAGIEIHANITSQIVSAATEGRALIETRDESEEWLWIFAWGWVGAILGWRSQATISTAFILLLAAISLFAGSYFLFLWGWWVPSISPFIALTVAGVALTGYIARVEREDRKIVMNLFARHVTPKIAAAIWRDRDLLLKEGQLVGQKMTATVLFTDLKGFTTIAEHTDPATLMSWLNEYMNAMANVVLEHDGAIDKFIGDAIMAVFGVPIPRSTPAEIARDAIAAVSCALAMGKKLRSLNEQWEQRGCPTVAMRVGIATGTVVAGSLGCPQRVDYTILGDTVNVASRLESFDKSLDSTLCRILISEETYQYIDGQFPADFLVCVGLKGREEPVKIYRVPLDSFRTEAIASLPGRSLLDYSK